LEAVNLLLEPKLGEMYAIFVTGNYAEVKAVFDKLAAGAEKDRFQELHAMPFGMYGQMYDKFHRHWIFVADEKNTPVNSAQK
jgi:PhnB protein